MSGGVRILAGELKGRRLPVPASARPTASRVRGSLFDIWGDRVLSARVLELFAGSGAVALEAVSRGAEEAVMVESDRGALASLRRSCTNLAPDRTRIIAARLPAQWARVVPAKGRGFDLVFADPPYDFTALGELVATLAEFLAPRGQVVLEHSRRSDPGDVCGELRRSDSRTYGDHVLSFFEPASVDRLDPP